MVAGLPAMAKEHVLFQASGERRLAGVAGASATRRREATPGHIDCEAQEFPSSWGSFWNSTEECGGDHEFKVLTYQLYWEKFIIGLFGRPFNESSKLLVEPSGPFDLIGFQECDDVETMLGNVGLNDSYGKVHGPHGLAIAYKEAIWEKLGEGSEDVAEDEAQPGNLNPADRTWGGHFGMRATTWVRLQHRASGKAVFFANHHGPLPMNTGGKCGEEITARSLLRTFFRHAQATDLKILAGDLNAEADSQTQQVLAEDMHRVAESGVDAIFSSCGASTNATGSSWNWGNNAIEAVFRL
jgi:hypothetical protein